MSFFIPEFSVSDIGRKIPFVSFDWLGFTIFNHWTFKFQISIDLDAAGLVVCVALPYIAVEFKFPLPSFLAIPFYKVTTIPYKEDDLEDHIVLGED